MSDPRSKGSVTERVAPTQPPRDSGLPQVLVIDDDADVREGIGSLLRSVGFQTQLFSSVADFLKTELPEGPACLVSDVRMPGKSGLELQSELSSSASMSAAVNLRFSLSTRSLTNVEERIPLNQLKQLAFSTSPVPT